MSRLTIKRFTVRIARLYEQGADYLRIGVYVKHWVKWVRTGLRRKGWAEYSTMNRKRQYTPEFGEYWRLYNESILVNNYLAIINYFLFTSTSYFCSGKSDYADTE